MRRFAIAAFVLAAFLAPAVARAQASSTVTGSTTVFVPGTASGFFAGGGPAVATGVFLQAGERFAVSSTGLASCSIGGCFDDANGVPGSPADPTFLAPGAPIFSLVGRYGTSGPWVSIGTGAQTATSSGELFLGYNDNFFGDNAGGWTVTIGPAVDVPAPETNPSVPTVSYCAPATRGWTFLQISTPGQLESGFWHDAIADRSTVTLADQAVTFTGETPVLAALVPHVGLTCDQPWFVNGTYADPSYALRGAEWDAAFAGRS